MKRLVATFICVLLYISISSQAFGQFQLVRLGQANGGGPASGLNYQLRESAIGVTVEDKLIKSPSYQIGGFYVKSLPWPIDRERTEIKVEPSVVVADGSASAKITVTLVDLSGDFVPNREVALNVSGEGNLLDVPKAITNTSGQAIFNLRSTKDGEKLVSIIVDSEALTQKPSIVFKSSRKKSFITLDVEPPQPRLGDKLKVKGEIILEEGEAKGKFPIKISYKPPKGEEIIQILQTDESKGYIGEFEVKEKGKWEISASWEGNEVFNPSQKSRSIDVLKGLSQIIWQPLELEKERIKVGDKISLIAQLKPALESQTIKVQIIKPDGISRIENKTTQLNGTFQIDIELTFEGTWKIVATWEGNEDNEKTSAEKPIFVPPAESPKVIIVLGGGNERENPAWNKFSGLANYVYKILKNRKLSDDDIYYLSPTLKVTEAIDRPTSEIALEFAITQWAKQKVGPKVPLFIYLLSHNLNDKFILEKQGELEVILTPEKLSGWLDVLSEGTQVTIIIEACYTGNFIRKKSAEKSVLSKPGRVIITSASNDRQAIIEGVSLLSFTRHFFDEISKNRDVKTAFLNTRNTLRASRSLQNPQIDANGDGVSNDPIRDFPAVGNKYIPADIQILPSVPEIQDVSKPQQLKVGEKSATIKVRLTGVDISKVSGTVIPPNYDPEREFKDWSDVDFETIKFEKKEEGLYEGKYDNFVQVGKYTIVVSAENPDGSAVPVETTVEVATLPCPPWDVNCDEEVNIFDLVVVAGSIGPLPSPPPEQNPDVNRDGNVDIFDLVLIATHFGEKTGATTVKVAPMRDIEYSKLLSNISLISQLRQLLEAIPNPNAAVSKAISELERLLARLTATLEAPSVTKLLPNYPNPFNPETWIPYQLKDDNNVTITIYDVSGRLVRKLDLGHKHAGFYISKDKAAYWNGTNLYGEKVASGVYFYTFKAGSFIATEKLLMIK